MRATGTRVVETETFRRDIVWLRPRVSDYRGFVARSAKVRGGRATARLSGLRQYHQLSQVA